MLTLQVQLLISAQDVENYKVIKSELDRLRTMVEKSELWVDKKSSGKGEEVEAGTATDKKEVSGWLAGTGMGGPEWVGRASLTCVLHPQRPTDEEGFQPPPGEKSSENYQIVKGVSVGFLAGSVHLSWSLSCPLLPCWPQPSEQTSPHRFWALSRSLNPRWA